MLCPNCQNNLADGAKFCNRCGTAIPAAAPIPQPIRPARQPRPVQPVQQSYAAPQPRPVQPAQLNAYAVPPQPYAAAPGMPGMPGMPVAAAPVGKKKSNGALIAVLVSVVLVLAGVAAYLIFSNKDKNEGEPAETGIQIEVTQAAPVETTAAVETLPAGETLPAPETEPPTTLNVTFWYTETQNYIDFEIPASGYVIEDSDVRRISESELYGMTEHQVCIARNEIYARHGNIFSGQIYIDYFNHMPWYTEISKNVSLTQIEKDNVATITAYEKSRGW